MAIVNGDNTSNNLFGTTADDILSGFGDFDLLFASLGNDTLDGGTDTDVAIYDVGLFTNGVFINNTDTAIGTILARTVDKRGFGIDTLIDVSNFHGTEFDDTIYVGGLGGTYSFDKAGDDLVVASQDPDAEDHSFLAGSGNDTLIGTVDRDRVDYDDTDFDGAGPITQGVDVDLAAGTGIDGWGDTDSLISIERVTGTNFDDTIRGSDDRNDFRGLQGNDILDGRGGDDDRAEYDQDPTGVLVDLAAGIATDGWGDTDTLFDIERAEGSEFNDALLGDDQNNEFEARGGDDLLEGHGGNDYLEGGAGNDTIDGGAGDGDMAAYRDAQSGVSVDIAAGTASDGNGTNDILIGIEQVNGSRHNDTIRGDDSDNHLQGREGDDLIEGRDGRDTFRGSSGNDTLDGGDGDDRAEYQRDADRGGAAGVTVNLTTGIATDGFGDTDTLISIEDIRATSSDDILIGNDEDNRINPGSGSDIIEGGGQTSTNQGKGDELAYSDLETGPINATFTGGGAGTVLESDGAVDTFTGIEELYGTEFEDTINGADDAESLRGQGGNDFITGNAGNDDLSGEDGDDTLDGGVGGDFLQPGRGTDVIIGGDNGTLFEDDQLSYFYDSRDQGETGGISVNFTNATDGTVVDYGGDTDTFTGIERVRGTNNDDVFISADGDQEFSGMGGNDTFQGGGGNEDRLNYSAGDDDPLQVQGINIDLNAGTGTDRYGDTDTFSGIEEVRGSNMDDTLIGDDNRNRLQGDDGNDLIDSFGGVDNSLDGGRGNDTINARGDSDFAGGGDGNDLITFFGTSGNANPGLGSDTIVGGNEGFFSINYNGIGESVVIDTALGTTQMTGGDVDTFTNIRNVEGGDGDDTLLGDDNEDYQRFRTSAGDDFIDGRGGTDEIQYDDDNETSVVIDFINGTVVGDYTGTDTFVNIERARGSDGDDIFIGNDEDNRFRGQDGVDFYDGNGGVDEVNFSGDRFDGGVEAVNIDFNSGTTNDGWGNAETFENIERVVTTDFDDTITGNGDLNVLIGILGDDTIDGGAGDDRIYAGGGIDTVTGGTGGDAFGGRLFELDGDTFTDFTADDRLQVFDDDFNLIGADVIIVGNEMRIDTTGDGVADATVTLTNGYTGSVNNEGGPIGSPVPTTFSLEDAGLFTAVATEGDVVANVTINRSGDIFSTATVIVGLTGTGLNPIDADDIGVPFNAPILITFGPGQTQIIYQIGITDDLDVEGVEDLAFTISNPTSDGAGGAEIDGNQTFVRILDNDMAETVSITGEKSPEDSGVLTYTVTRTGDTSEEITVEYDLRSAGGIQGAESDDVAGGLPQSGSVTIAAGETQTTITVGINPDAIAEAHDDVIATISQGDDWPEGLTVGVAQAIGSIRNDDGVPPVLPIGATGSNFGDPHIVTLDGLAYDFQAVGEFTLIEATSGDALNVQVRFQPVSGSEVASQTTAVATTLGSARVTIDTDGSSLVRVDGVSFDIESAAGGVAVGNGDIYFDGQAITLVYANGEQLRVDVFDGFLSTSVSIAEGRDVQGLLGNANGDTTDDLALPDGTVLTQPIAFADLYGVFANAWRIDQTDALFDYAPGETTADFTDLTFPAAGLSLDDFPIEVVTAAQAAAINIQDPTLRDAAILDYLLSGDTAFIEAASVVGGGLDGALTEIAPTDAPSIASGLGVSVSTAKLAEGDDGSQTASFTIYRTGDASEALSVSYAMGGTADTDDYEGSTAGLLEFETGERTKEVSVGVIGDTIVEDTETLTLTLAVAGATGPVMLSSIAALKIENDDIAAPSPAPVANDDAFVTDEDTAVTGNLFADNGTGADEGNAPVTELTLGDGTNLAVGVTSDLGDGSSLLVTEDGDFTFDPGDAFQALNTGQSDSFAFTYGIGSGASADTADVTITINGDDDTTIYNQIIGTQNSDYLRGTAGDDMIYGLAGRYDKLVGNGGADLFVFGEESDNGRRERDLIKDFEVGIDAILLTEGTSVARIRETSKQVVIFLDDDRDAIYVRGEDVTADNITILTDDFNLV